MDLKMDTEQQWNSNGDVEVKFRKKPVVIEAYLYEGFDEFWFKTDIATSWLVQAVADGIVYPGNNSSYYDEESVENNTYIKTLEGNHLVSPGDWIIQGVHGELYPCKDAIFQLTYERVEDSC